MKTAERIIVSLALAILMIGCRSKKMTTEKEEVTRIDTVYQERIVTDTLVVTETIEKTKPVYFETKIPCDKEQSGTVGSGENLFNYKIKDGKIQFDFKLDSTNCITREEYRSKVKNDSLAIVKQLEKRYISQEEIKVYVYPWWVLALGIGCIIFALLWIRKQFF